MQIFCLSQNFTNNIILGHVHIREISCSHFQRQPLKGSSKKNVAVLPDAFPTQATIKLLSGLNVHTHLSAR